MPYGEPDVSDPHALVGVSLPGDAAATREMAMAFAEEFARMGWTRERILGLFEAPGFRASHAALELLGRAEIERVVDDAVTLWGGVRVRIQDADCACGTPSRHAHRKEDTPCPR